MNVHVQTFRPTEPYVLPDGWAFVQRSMDGARYVNERRQMSVIVSGAVELDGKRWVHASMSGVVLPSYDDLKMLKDVWIGRNRTAYQVFPPNAMHVNINSTCLHLWSCLDGDPTPDFTHGTGSL